jgi:acetyltransferase
MTIRNLDRVFKPSSVALIGASPRQASVGQVVLQNLRSSGFSGPIDLINPKHQTIDGLPCYPDAGALPKVPDLAVVATPAPSVPAIIEQLGRRGTKAVVVISAGFGGEAGRQLKQQMLSAARPHLLRIVGPNCVGILVPGIGLNASFAHLTPMPGKIAFLAQSGAILTSVIDWAAAREIGFSHLVSMGEMADVDFGDMLDYLANDVQVGAILMYVEAVTNARKFMSAARRASRLKPVIVIKAGRYGATTKAVASHTGALAGSDAVYDAVFRRAGTLRVFDLDELFEAVETLAAARPPAGDRLAILTDGGGIGILAADALVGAGGRLAELSPQTIAHLDAVLPAAWSRGNPVDIIGDAPPERYAQALEILRGEPNADAILVLNCPTAIAPGIEAARAVVDTIGTKECSIFTSWVGEKTAGEARRLFGANRIPTYDIPEHAVRAFSHMVRYRHNQALLAETPPSLPTDFSPDMAAAHAIIARVLDEGRDLLTAPESRAVLRAYGIATVEEVIVKTPAEAAEAAGRIGSPVALKILSPDITHKSDVGGVVLDLATPEQAEAAAAAMLDRVSRERPAARITGLAVEPMVRRAQAHELIVGASEDPQFGPVILFGHGGVAVEVVADRALALPPLNLKLARELMAETRVFRLLQGYRDRPPAALGEIALTLVKVSQLIIDIGEIVELDINPLLADGSSVIALDARLRVKRTDKPAAARLAIRPYPRELEETIALADGTRFLLRPIRPEDEPTLQAAFKKLSPESIRMRFFASLHDFSHELAARLTQIDYDREMALVLTEVPPATEPSIYGVVRITSDPDKERAEFAVIVRDDVAGRGLGTLLMEKIIAYTSSCGIGEIFGDVLSENETILSICRHLGFTLHRDMHAPGTIRVSKVLEGSRS